MKALPYMNEEDISQATCWFWICAMASSICRVKYTDGQDSHQFSLDVGRVVRQLTASWCMVLLLSRLFGSLDVNLWCLGIVPLINRINLVLSCCRCIIWLCQWISPNSRHHVLEVFQLLVPFVLCSVSCARMHLFFLVCAHFLMPTCPLFIYPAFWMIAFKLIIQDSVFVNIAYAENIKASAIF